MKNIFKLTALLVLTLFTTNAVAQELKVAGQVVSSTGNVTGSWLKGGSVYYDASKTTLTLNNALIEVTESGKHGIDSSIDGLTIKVTGTCSVRSRSTATIFGKPTTITGGGTLTALSSRESGIYMVETSLTIRDCMVDAEGVWGIAGVNGTKGEHLTIDNATVTAKGDGSNGSICDIASLTLNGCKLTQPSGAAYNASLRGVALNGSLVKGKVVISRIETYNLKIAGVQVTSDNAYDIKGSNIVGSGRISYDAATNTLTLDDATIRITGSTDAHGIESDQASSENLLIKLIGKNYIHHTGTDGINRSIYLRNSTRITGPGWLVVYRDGGEAVLIDDNKTLTFDGGCYVSIESNSSCGLRGNSGSKLVVNNAELKVRGAQFYSIGKGFTSLTMTGVSITSPTGAAFSSSLGGVALNGSLVKDDWVRIGPPIKYPVWVAGVQVTSENKSNITGSGISGGTVSFNPDANWLILSGARVIMQDDNINSHGIYVKDQDLTISVLGGCYVRAVKGTGIYAENSNLTIRGPQTSSNMQIEVEGGMHGIVTTNSTNLTIRQCDVGVSSEILDPIVTGNFVLESRSFLYALYLGYTPNLYGMNTTGKVTVGYMAELQVDTDKKGFAIKAPGGLDIYKDALLFEGDPLVQVSAISMSNGKTLAPRILIRPSGTGLETLTSHGIQVVGSKSEIRISLDTDEHKYASVYNLTGALVRVAELEGKETAIGNLQPGIYVVRIGNGAEKVVVR